MKHRLDQIDLIEPDERGHKRIREPSERAERGGGPKKSIEAVLFELLLLTHRRVIIEVALVGDRPDDRKPPRLRRELVLLGRGQDHGECVGLQLRKGRVGAPHVELEHVDRVVPRLHHESELGLSTIIGRGVDNHIRDGATGTQDIRLGDACPDHIHGRARRGERDDQDDHAGSQ